MKTSNIISFYENASDFDKALFLDVLEDISIVHKAFSKVIPDLENGINGLRNLLGNKEDTFAINAEINCAISYRKTNKFADFFSAKIVGRSEEDLSHIRLQRFRFVRELIAAWYITVIETIKNNELTEISKEFDEGKEFLRGITKTLSNWEVIISFSNIKQSESKKTIFIWDRWFRINSKKNVPIFLYIHLLQKLIEEIWPNWINRIINAYFQWSLETEDIESIIFNVEMDEINKLKRILTTWEERVNINEWHFNENGDLFINNWIKPFTLWDNAINAKRILRLIGKYIFSHWKVSQFNQWELREFYKVKKEEFHDFTLEAINFSKWESGFERTFENTLLKFYKENKILRIKNPHIVLLGKDL